MNLNLTIPRPSTLLLAGLVLALLVSTPIPLTVVAAVLVWLLHTPVALLCGALLTLAYRATHPTKRHA